MEKIEPVKEIPKSQLVDVYLMDKMHVKINEMIKFLNITRDEIVSMNKKTNEVVETVNTLIKDKE